MTNEQSECQVLEAARLLFMLSRKECSRVETRTVNQNTSLRKTMAKKIVNEAKKIMPNVDSETWSKAVDELIKG